MKAWATRDVIAYLDRVAPALRNLDHFELLDVAIEADEEAVQDAFHRIAGGIHPDRHRNELSAAQFEQLTIVYGRIAEAYRVLRDDSERDKYLRDAAYKRKKEGSKTEASGDESQAALLSPKAQRLYRRAQAALRTGDRTSAMLNLKMALRQHPNSTLLKELLARAKK